MTLCGSDKPHAIKSCKDCHRLHMRQIRDRQRTDEQRRQLEAQRKRAEQDEILLAKFSKWCPSCQMRHRMKPLEPQPYYNPWAISPRLFMWIENAARVFDEEAGEEKFTAAEFVAWLRPDVIRKKDAA